VEKARKALDVLNEEERQELLTTYLQRQWWINQGVKDVIDRTLTLVRNTLTTGSFREDKMWQRDDDIVFMRDAPTVSGKKTSFKTIGTLVEPPVRNWRAVQQAYRNRKAYLKWLDDYLEGLAIDLWYLSRGDTEDDPAQG
jgi:hypothetical protein